MLTATSPVLLLTDLEITPEVGREIRHNTGDVVPSAQSGGF